MIDLINPYVLRILISAREEDTINSISHRIRLSYGWTHKWVNELAKKGVFKLTRMMMYLNKDNEFYTQTISYVRQILSRDIPFNYEFLSLLGIKYCFTKTDAVFVWTKGGYNISRYKEFYPIFVKVKREDKPKFEKYCRNLGLGVNKNKGIFFNVDYLDDFDTDFCNNIPVDNLDSTIQFMTENIYNFEPALEMISEMYNRKIKIKYKEVKTNV